MSVLLYLSSVIIIILILIIINNNKIIILGKRIRLFNKFCVQNNERF